jgi:hypothetical protein
MIKLFLAAFAIALSSSPAMPAAPLDVCDLLEHAAQYQGKEVRVRGSQQDGVACPSGGILWVEGDHGETFIGPYNPLPSNVTMVVVGTFHWKAGADDPYRLKAKTFESVIGPSHKP